jgi:hypothetical protein
LDAVVGLSIDRCGRRQGGVDPEPGQCLSVSDYPFPPISAVRLSLTGYQTGKVTNYHGRQQLADLGGYDASVTNFASSS